MPRNFLFLLDVSDNTRHEVKKFEMTSAALKKFIGTLEVQDTFSIQTFAHEGTMDVWGPNQGTEDEKQDAINYLHSLKPDQDEWYEEWGTNLHAAIIEALIRAKTDINEGNIASMLVIFSNGWASRGETERAKIVQDIYGYNKDGSVKIFTLGYQHNADLYLLDAISLMNGGVSLTITNGEEDFESQIMRFLESELGSILLSDMTIKFPEGIKVIGETETSYPLLASGYEVAVRGLVDGRIDVNDFKTVTKASTLEEVQSWVTSASSSASSATTSSSLCYQSYAHARVAQLVRLSDAANFLDDKLLRTLVNLANPACNEKEFAKCIEQEAINLALDAGIVAKGLTAMVTVDSEECMKVDESTEVCRDGTTVDEYAWEYSGIAMDMESPSAMPFCSFIISVFACATTLLLL
eukprot:scaffold56389_cov75-Cyclotella_meneghiniana.AAC.11